MGRDLLLNVGTATVMTVVIAVLLGDGAVGLLTGAAYALVLAFGVWVGGAWTRGAARRRSLPPRDHARGAVVATALGALTWWVAGADNGAFFAVGVILAISVSTATALATSDTRSTAQGRPEDTAQGRPEDTDVSR